jgi:hypothetical protein
MNTQTEHAIASNRMHIDALLGRTRSKVWIASTQLTSAPGELLQSRLQPFE